MWNRRLATLVVCGAASVASTMVTLSTQTSAGGAPARSAKSLDVVGGPIAVGSTAVVISVDRTRVLHLDGIDPVSDSVLWQRPYSASAVTPGAALAPAAVGNTVLDVVPVSKPSNPAVRIAGVDASTGAVEWEGSTGVVLSDNPASCANKQDFCVTGYNSDGSSSLILFGASGQSKGEINGPNRAIGPNLYQSDASTPTFQQLSAGGTIAWTKTVAAIFGPGYDPSSGWAINPVGNLDVGSVGHTPSGRTYNYGALKTLGFDIATGTPEWSVAGAYLCMGPLVFLTTQVTCQFTGTVHYGKGLSYPSLRGLTLKLAGFTTTNGAVTWTLPVSNVASLTFGNNLRFLDSTQVVVRPQSTSKVVLLNTLTGATAPLKKNQILWCEKTPFYSVVTTKGASLDGKRISAPVFYPCTANGKARAAAPPSYPSTVGTTVNGVFVWPSPTGLSTHVVGEPSTSA
jgi:hypothetical protein